MPIHGSVVVPHPSMIEIPHLRSRLGMLYSPAGRIVQAEAAACAREVSYPET
jgi:hypothetical protein